MIAYIRGSWGRNRGAWLMAGAAVLAVSGAALWAWAAGEFDAGPVSVMLECTRTGCFAH